jgi:hypothetical protein
MLKNVLKFIKSIWKGKSMEKSYEQRAIEAMCDDDRLVDLIMNLNESKRIGKRIREAQKREDVIKTVIRNMGGN